MPEPLTIRDRIEAALLAIEIGEDDDACLILKRTLQVLDEQTVRTEPVSTP